MYWKSMLNNRRKVSFLSESSKITNFSKKRNKKKSKFHSILTQSYRLLDEYCSQSTLHGLKYMRDATLPINDRIFWFGMFLLSLVMSSVVMIGVWQEWVDNQFIIIHDSIITPIWEVPFPSVTICSYFMIKKSYIDLLKSTDRKLVEYSKRTCSDPDLNFDMKLNLDYFESEEIYTGEDFYNFLRNATPSCKEMFKSCTFRTKSVDCCTLFQPILTHLGHCYVFNSIPNEVMYKNTVTPLISYPGPKDTIYWDLEKGYPKHHLMIRNGTSILPNWLEFAGEDFGLIVELIQNVSEWQLPCSGSHTGFQALITSPANSPVLTTSAIRIPTKTEMSLVLRPETVRTDRGLINIPPPVRGCLYARERDLDHFQYYTQDNCIEECYGLMAYTKCGCVPYYIPRNRSFRICFESDYFCLSTIWEDLMKGVEAERHSKCGCMPCCTELMYNMNHHYSPITPRKTKSLMLHHDDTNRQEELLLSRFRVYFKFQQFNGMHRQIQTSLFEFLGLCGGLLGLFLGFSCMSAFELFYFFVIRPFNKVFDKQFQNKPKNSPLKRHIDEINRRLNRFN